MVTSPRDEAWELHRAWPQTELVIVDEAGHAGDETGLTSELIRATDRFASSRQA
jgi:proline iminopeptidase